MRKYKVINNIQYKPTGEWSDYDFLINKYFWIKHGLKNAETIRKNNLIDIRKVIVNNDIVYWTQGR
ncbi:hypothetical protein THIOM_003210, partial [Candidatus Thiomargarita nelsonii]